MPRRRWWPSGDERFDFGAGSGGARPDGDDLRRLLLEGEVRWVKPIPWGSNYSFAARLSAGAHECVAVYKPRQGEVPLWDFPDGTLYRREYCAFLVSQALGLGFVPMTVLRDGPHGVGTFQLYVDADESAEYYGFREQHVDELRAIALFDVITNNADRKAGHCLKGVDGRIWGIDHGLTFNVAPKLRTVIWDFCGQELPPGLYQSLFDVAVDEEGRRSRLRDELREHLHPNEVEAFFVRLERVVERGEFPTLDPYRNVPRGFF